MEATEVSEYEQHRLQNIDKNNKYLNEIGIDTSKRDKVIVKVTPVKRKHVVVEPTKATRRSLRTKEFVNYADVCTLPRMNAYIYIQLIV